MAERRRKVYIENTNSQYNSMFLARGWVLIDDVRQADLVQFTGGSDVNPELYGEVHHPSTFASPGRDERESRLFSLCRKLRIPMAGICRGGQFLNVKSGGRMWQDVNNHAIHGTHSVINTVTGEVIPCTSTHHQMMDPDVVDGIILGKAGECTRVTEMAMLKPLDHVQVKGEDIEVVYYENTNALCFQPHPEYLSKISPCQAWYFQLIDTYLYDMENV